MTLARLILLALLLLALNACAVLGIGHDVAGVKIVGKQKYCGTASQSSEIHYLPTQTAFDNWVEYRDVGNWHENVPSAGILIVEMGQRPTGGYKLKLDADQTAMKDDTLTIGFNWQAPRTDAAVSQAMTTQCVAVALPAGEYNQVVVLDQLGNSRGAFTIER